MIRRVDARETYPLRQQVLRPHQRIDQVGFPGENDPETVHLAAGADGRIIGIVTVLHESPGLTLATPEPADWWRIRGMATAQDYRHRGVGSALIQTALAQVAARPPPQDGSGLWCNARLGAVDFYRRVGFATSGQVWDEPGLGPHVKMWRLVPPSISSP